MEPKNRSELSRRDLLGTVLAAPLAGMAPIAPPSTKDLLDRWLLAILERQNDLVRVSSTSAYQRVDLIAARRKPFNRDLELAVRFIDDGYRIEAIADQRLTNQSLLIAAGLVCEQRSVIGLPLDRWTCSVPSPEAVFQIAADLLACAPHEGDLTPPTQIDFEVHQLAEELHTHCPNSIDREISGPFGRICWRIGDVEIHVRRCHRSQRILTAVSHVALEPS